MLKDDPIRLMYPTMTDEQYAEIYIAARARPMPNLPPHILDPILDAFIAEIDRNHEADTAAQRAPRTE